MGRETAAGLQYYLRGHFMTADHGFKGWRFTAEA
jgi:hypothetical protein